MVAGAENGFLPSRHLLDPEYLEHLHKIGSQWFTNVFLHGSPLLITQRVLHVADNCVDPFEGQAAATIRMRNQGDFFEPRQVDPDDEGAAVTHGPDRSHDTD